MTQEKQLRKWENINCPVHRKLSINTENYLYAMYLLYEKNEKITATTLLEYIKQLPSSENLGTSLPTVTGMLKRMVRDHLITKDKNNEIFLTEYGKISAKEQTKRFRLASKFLHEILKIKLEDVFQEAHRLEHAMSQDVENSIDKLLDYPDKDPFGQTIPGIDFIKNEDNFPLTKTLVNKSYVVSKIPPENVEFVEFLNKNKVLPGSKISITELSDTRGIISIKIKNNKVDLGLNIAKSIWVKNI
jgi:DtxR family Mn-dependent transcriptional regulator|tara:strand:- start:2011 stop:2745 length:735 start_codon:yes stop_codon:yes gene_type:complete